MKTLIVIVFLFFSIVCKSQQYVSKNFMDSLHRAEQGNLGKHFPNFKEKDINGNTFSDSGLKGKVTLINFWFEGCHPCVAEFPSLNNIYEKFHSNKMFDFISFTFESPEGLKEIISKYSLKFPVVPISEEECHRLNFYDGFPVNIIVDTKGKVAFFKSGGSVETEKASLDIDTTILPELQQLLKKSK